MGEGSLLAWGGTDWQPSHRHDYLLAFRDGTMAVLTPPTYRPQAPLEGSRLAPWRGRLAALGWQFVRAYDGAAMTLYRRPRRVRGGRVN